MLFDPATLGPLRLPNRMVMAPMTRTRASETGVPTPLMAEYYAQRAAAGLIVTECTQISDQAHGIIRAPGLHREDQVAAWRPVIDRVHAQGGRIFCQLWHCGRASHPGIRGGQTPVAPSAIAAAGAFFLPTGRVPYPTPRALETAEIPPIVQDFEHAARNALSAGFDGVELHGAFGYLPDQFLQDASNHRTDRYGGSIQNRARFMLDVTEAMAGVWGAHRVGVKLSPSNRQTGMNDSSSHATFAHVITELNALRLAYLHLMEPARTDLETGTVQVRHVAATFRPLVTTALIANGGFDKPKAEAALADGSADLVSFGVPFLANPDLPRRFREDAPLNTPDPTTFYGEGPKGYTDYPPLGPA